VLINASSMHQDWTKSANPLSVRPNDG